MLIGNAPPPAGVWMTEIRIHEILERRYGDVRLPDPGYWSFAASTVRFFQIEPPTNNATGTMTDAVRQHKRERETLDTAAKILEADSKRFFRGNAEWQRRYAEAIQMLRMRRGAADNRRDQLSKISPQGPSMTGWAYAARQILGRIVPILMHHKIAVSSRHTSPLVKSLRDMLGFIYPPETLPSAATLSKVVAEYLDG